MFEHNYWVVLCAKLKVDLAWDGVLSGPPAGSYSVHFTVVHCTVVHCGLNTVPV